MIPRAPRLGARIGLIAAIAIASGSWGCRSKGTAAGDGGFAGLPFIEDDYEGALRRAKAEHHLLFIDAWAPWCHTCLSLRNYVFGDPALAPIASRFVWAAIDTEKTESALFLRKFPMKNWPTLWVVDPATEKPVLKWMGAVTAPELVTLLESAHDEWSRTSGGTAEATAAWLRGNHKTTDGDRNGAIVEYRSALELAPPRWAVRAGVVEALANLLQATGSRSECLVLTLGEWPKLPAGTSRVNLIAAALGCAEGLPPNAPERAAVDALATSASTIAADPNEPILADDRSSLFEGLVAFYRDGGNEKAASAIARRWSDFLDGEAARAPNARARTVFDSHRMLAYIAAGEPARAIPMLEQTEREFPDEYNAPSRLAKVYLDLGRLDEALSAVRRAEARVYGPRSLRVLAMEADIFAAMQKPKESKEALARAIALGEKLELTSGYRDLLEHLKRRASAI